MITVRYKKGKGAFSKSYKGKDSIVQNYPERYTLLEARAVCATSPERYEIVMKRGACEQVIR